MAFPNEEELDRAILLKRGVPASAIHFYGDGVSSTFLEAEAFKAAARPEGKKVLVLTSRYHARRAKLIFRKVLAGSEVRMFGAAD
ncbi:MAG: YdcF family protein, partial [Elusimicrobia bacterium]|nr:YdcF family protein [Elusimicrobiota bacterium]